MAPAPAINLVSEPCRWKRGGVRSPVRVDAAMSTRHEQRAEHRADTVPDRLPIARRRSGTDCPLWSDFAGQSGQIGCQRLAPARNVATM
jgi:hypothetical protein